MATQEETPEGVAKYTRSEVSQHNNLKETWLIIHNNVYDVTNFLNEVIWVLILDSDFSSRVVTITCEKKLNFD